MTLHERLNRSGFSRFLNSRAGVAFRLTAGSAFLIVGFLYRSHPLAIASMVWSFFPLTTGAFDWCYISALLGGPLSGKTIRSGEGSS